MVWALPGPQKMGHVVNSQELILPVFQGGEFSLVSF